jgi:hypothetical protein
MNIICLGYLLRGSRAWPEGIFDLIREPVRQGCAIDIGEPPEALSQNHLLGGFNIEAFKKLAGVAEDNQEKVWQQTFFNLPAAALDYLHQHLPADCLVLCFEISPWLESALNQWTIPFIDIRISPLRFGRDLYIAMRSNDETLQARIAEYQIADEELRLEAGYLAANVRMHQQRLIESGRLQPSLENATIFIGQAPYDASLIRSDGNMLTFADYKTQISALTRGRKLLHKPHPFATWFAEEEQRLLEEISGQKLEPCPLNAYQILACRQDVELIGLSSGLLQEAAWFNKKAYILYQSFTPLSSQIHGEHHYLQIHFQRWLSPGFWHQLLTPKGPVPRILEVSQAAHHHARHTFDHWWDYLKVLTWEKTHAYESFERSGGGALRQRIATLEAAVSDDTIRKADFDK